MNRFLKPIFGLAIILLLANCSDDEPQASGDETLNGTWELTALRAETTSVVDFFGLPISSTSESVGSNFDYIITFDEGTYEAAGGYDLATTVEIPGQGSQTSTFEFRDLVSSGTFSLEDGRLTVDDSFFDLGTSEITSVTEIGEQVINFSFNGPDEVTFTQDQAFTVTDPDSGTEVSIDIDMNVQMRRRQ